MKKLLFLIFLFTSQSIFPQDTISEEEKIESLVRVWGLLKYQHPEVSRGKFDMDQQFLDMFEQIQSIQSREKFNLDLTQWVISFGSNRYKPDPDFHKETNLFSKNSDFLWIKNSGFSPELISFLVDLKTNRNYKNYYASVNKLSHNIEFENEKRLANFDAQNKAHRQLFLASFWNAMKYWNVNIYLSKTPWEEVLPEMIPAFMDENSVAFEQAKEKLISKISDSHGNYLYSSSLNSLTKFPDFGGRIVNDSLVVTVLFDKTGAKEDGIAMGDVIFEVNDTNLKDYYKSKFEDVISVSNENYLRSAVERSFLLAGIEDSVKVGILKKDGNTVEKYIQLKELSYPAEKYVRNRPAIKDNYKKLSEDIGYLNLHTIDNATLKTAFKEFKGTKGIIIDLRNYPRNISPGSLPGYLYPERKTFVKILTAKKPGFGHYDSKAALRFIKDPFSAGKRNKNFYKGKIILLVDRTTASQGEWIAMAIQAGPNTITMGEQTFGAVLNRNEFPLKDNTTVDFTKAGAFYPNDQSVQGTGLKIDHHILESAKDYNEDLYLQTAKDLMYDEKK